jgi:hypothetical protein
VSLATRFPSMRAPNRHAAPRAVPFVVAIKSCRADRARSAASSIDPLIGGRQASAGRVLRPALGVGADQRRAEPDQPGEVVDRADRLVR